MTFQEYQNDDRTRLAVERCVEIISEAVRHMPLEVQADHPAIPWDDIKGIGNILRHGYDKVDDRIIWNVLKRHLEPLEATLAAIEQSRIQLREVGEDLPAD